MTWSRILRIFTIPEPAQDNTIFNQRRKSCDSAYQLSVEKISKPVEQMDINNEVREVGVTASGPGVCENGSECAATVLTGNYRPYFYLDSFMQHNFNGSI